MRRKHSRSRKSMSQVREEEREVTFAKDTLTDEEDKSTLDVRGDLMLDRDNAGTNICIS